MNRYASLSHHLLFILLVFGLLGCGGRDRFDDCYFNGEPVPEYEISVYNAVTGEKICWTEFRSPGFVGDKGWQYQGPCEYTFENGEHSHVSNITATASGFEPGTLENVRKPADYLCILEGEQTVVDFHLVPVH